MKVGVSLADVSLAQRCVKPGCSTRRYRLHRHHVRHPYMFVAAFVRTRSREHRYRQFVKEYYEFKIEQIIRICESHHAEIHLIYDKIIQEDLRRTKKALRNYSWNQAEALMGLCATACKEWQGQYTPGVEPENLREGRRGVKGGFVKAVASMKKRLNA